MIYWPRFIECLRYIPENRIHEWMNTALGEHAAELKLPPRYLRSKNKSWDKRVEKTCFIATGETTNEMK
jgi:hypothetical protein